MLDVRRLRVLREVARLGSFSAAAESLAFTQPAVSRQIATLEGEAGTLLVERSARGIRLTPAGELLVEHADAILDRLALAESQLEALAALEAGRLRLAAFPSAGATLIPLAIATFTREHPRVGLSLLEATSGESVDMLIAGELDLAVVSTAGVALEPPEGVVFELLMDDPHYVALPSGHPLAGKPDLTLRDLAGETWIEGRQAACATVLKVAAARAGFEPRIAFDSAQWMGKQGLVAAGVGVSLIPQVALATAREDIVVRSLGQDAPSRRILLAASACGHHVPALEPMKAVLRSVAEEHCFSCGAMVDAGLAQAA